MKVLLASEMRALEQRAIAEAAIPSLLLMEAAAAELCRVCTEKLKDLRDPRVLIVAGRGNNGGDGLALARLLYRKKIAVRVVFVGRESTATGQESTAAGDAKTQLDMVLHLPIPFYTPQSLSPGEFEQMLADADLTVDAIFGTGFHGELKPESAFAISAMNRSAKNILAVDIPSGVYADGGAVAEAVRARVTVTFALPKSGLLLFPGADYAGEVMVADIGIPENLIEEQPANLFTFLPGTEEWKALLPSRPRRSNKGTYGKLLCVAGSREMPGAAMLMCRAAAKTGAGLVCAALPQSILPVFQGQRPECVTRALPEDERGNISAEAAREILQIEESHNAAAIGPGLGRGAGIRKIIEAFLAQNEKPFVLDADGLNAIAEHPNLLRDRKPSPCVITPHPGEMSRLTGLSVAEILRDPLGVARNFAKAYNGIVVLKDAHTIVANPSGQAYINLTGNPGMAKAGSGDVLTGVIGAFLAQGLPAFDAAVLGVYVHGAAGDAAAEKSGLYGILPQELFS